VAHRQFQESGGRQPQIFTFFKNGDIKMGSITNEVKTLLDFKEKLRALEHFYTSYENLSDLKLRFRDQLDKMERYEQMALPGAPPEICCLRFDKFQKFVKSCLAPSEGLKPKDGFQLSG